jgi:Rad3-related DNA helicase
MKDTLIGIFLFNKNFMIEREKIKQQCLDWAYDIFGNKFEFRPYQLETCVDTIYNVLNPEIKCQVVEAPTGSGKSNVAMVCAGVLWRYYKKRSYILASDLGLIDQYAKDFQKYNLNWGVIKGSENYLCTRNHMSFKHGECRIQKVPYKTLFNGYDSSKAGFDCAETCEYVMQRKLAMQAPVTLMTYSFFLIQRNSVAAIYESSGRSNDVPFEARDFIVCDECHKLGEIVQEQYSPKIDNENNDKLSELITFAQANGMKAGSITIHDFNKAAYNIFISKDQDELFEKIKEYRDLLAPLAAVNGVVQNMCQKNSSLYNDKEIRRALYLSDFALTLYGALEDYLNLISVIGKDCMVKNCDNADKIKLNCIYEDFLVKKYFHDKCGFELLLSATIGNSEIYANNIGIFRLKNIDKDKRYRFSKIPSTFDFSKSPIYFLPNFKMNYKEKDQNLPIVCNLIYQLFEKHKDEKGIVQTGSFAFSNYLFENAPKELRRRMLIYNDSKIKGDLIYEYKNSKNKILIGPSLTTGISLDGDLCRYLIVMKVPYPNLGDKLVKAKMEKSQLWYTNSTIVTLQQGFGRGVRFNGDYCISYVLDGCFGDLLKYNSHLIDKEILDRIVYLQ